MDDGKGKMTVEKATYWNNRIADKFSSVNKQIIPHLNDLEDFTTHLAPKGKDSVRKAIDAVHNQMRALAETIDKAIKEEMKGR